MLEFASALIVWLPRLFNWILAPMIMMLLALALWRKTRSRAALGFVIAAAVSATFLSLETAAFVYVCCDQARVILSILLDFRPGVTANFLFAILGSIGVPLLRLIPMLIAGAVAGTIAFVLRSRAEMKSKLSAGLDADIRAAEAAW
jgi:hypothetical protein